MTTGERAHRDYVLCGMAHYRELKRRGFRFATPADMPALARGGPLPDWVIGNYGWVGDVDGWVSKTSKGILETARVGPGRYKHTWSDD